MPNPTAPHPARFLGDVTINRAELGLPATPSASQPIPDALGYAVDRLDRLDHVLEELVGSVVRLGSKLEPTLTDGTYRADPQLDAALGEPVAEDTRSQLAQRIAGLGQRADQAADSVDRLRRRVEAITTAVEL